LIPPINGGRAWVDGENVAWCHRIGDWADKCLRSDCSCGFYSVWSRHHQYFHAGVGEIAGVIEMYGKVCVGGDGARSSKARIVALWLPSDTWSLFSPKRSIRGHYPNVRFYHNVDNMVSKEGVKKPTNLIYSGGFG